MQKVIIKALSIIMLLSLAVTPALAKAPEVVPPATDGVTPEEQAWVDTVLAADTFIVHLDEPSLAVYEGGNAILAAPERSESGAIDVNSPEAVAYLSYLNSRMDAILAEAEALLGRDLEVLFRYDAVINGFAARMNAEEAYQLRSLPGVKEVYPDEVMQLDTDVSPAFIGIDKVWDGTAVPDSIGSKGAGTIIGVLDTGINVSHPSFAQTTPLDTYFYINPYGDGVFKGLCASQPASYPCNNKLLGVYDFTGAGDGNDSDDHGSHTASTSAGNRIQVNYGGASVVISGMAPNAQVISYRVCNASGCDNSASTAAVNQAILDGVNSLNYSIGPRNGPPGNPWTNSVEVAFLEAFKLGISTATSAGNSGPGDSTVYKLPPWALVTGNTQHGRIFGYPVTINPGASQLDSIAILASSDLAPALAVDLVGKDLVWGGNVGNKEGCAAWPANALVGKVGIVQRGTCAFKDKLQYMQDAGALFALVYNNAPGAPIVMGTETGNVTIPGAMISLEDGLAMEAVAGSAMTVDIDKTLSSGTLPDWGDIIADSSSRGPITNFDMLEPDLVAPGTNILAAYSAPGAVDLMSGTSMAGPHVAGSTAVMRSEFPDWSPAAIRSAIIMTALAGTSVDYDLSEVTPFIYGNGRIDMSKAALAGLVMEVTYDQYKAANPASGGDMRALNIPSYQNSNCLGGCTFTRTLKNVAGVATDYTVGIEKTDGVGVTVTPNAFTIPAGGTQTITVKVEPSILSGGAWQFGRISFETTGKFASGKDISTTAFTLAAKAAVEGSNLPTEIRENVTSASGTRVLEELYNADPITNLTTVRHGMTPATVVNFDLAMDPTNANPYNNLEEVWWTTFSCPVNQQRIVVEVLSTTSNDLDIFIGVGNTPHKTLEKGSAATPGAMEYLSISNPAFSGTCWILVQNWDGSTEGDEVSLAYGLVSKTAANFTVTGPSSVPAVTPFELTIDWNLPAFETTQVWYGYFSVGTSSTNVSNVGKVDMNFYKTVPVLDEFMYLPAIFNDYTP